MSIATPEGLELELVLAGAGSRFIAGMLDLLVRIVVFAAVAALLGATGSFNGVTFATTCQPPPANSAPPTGTTPPNAPEHSAGSDDIPGALTLSGA